MIKISKTRSRFYMFSNEMNNKHVWKTSFYNRNIEVLYKSDYVFIRECLEKYLGEIQHLDIDNYEEIDQLKLLFIKLDHHLDRLIILISNVNTIIQIHFAELWQQQCCVATVLDILFNLCLYKIQFIIIRRNILIKFNNLN